MPERQMRVLKNFFAVLGGDKVELSRSENLCLDTTRAQIRSVVDVAAELETE
jgi:hypothetical protein